MITKNLIANLIGCFFYAIFLILLIAALSTQTRAHIFSETGPFEIFSFVLWFALALTLLFIVRPLNRLVWSMAALATVAGCRELDMHNRFTQESISRISYYLCRIRTSSGWNVWQCLLLYGLIVLSSYPLIHFSSWLYHRQGYLQPVGQIMCLIIVLVPATKIVDRLPAYLRGFFNISVSTEAVAVMNALEEGFEMLLPILFFQVVFMLPKRNQQLHTLAGFHRIA